MQLYQSFSRSSDAKVKWTILGGVTVVFSLVQNRTVSLTLRSKDRRGKRSGQPLSARLHLEGALARSRTRGRLANKSALISNVHWHFDLRATWWKSWMSPCIRPPPLLSCLIFPPYPSLGRSWARNRCERFAGFGKYSCWVCVLPRFANHGTLIKREAKRFELRTFIVCA